MTKKPTFQTEFPDFKVSEMPVIPAGFDDSSFQNDACPSFQSRALGLIVYVDYADTAQRELGADSDRFLLQALDSEGCLTGEQPLLATDDWAEVVAFIKARLAQVSPAILNAWYSEAVGYAPQEDSPSMSNEELRELCLEYFDEHMAMTAEIIAEGMVTSADDPDHVGFLKVWSN